MIDDRKIVAQLLSAIRRDLNGIVGPEVSSPVGQAAVLMMSDILGYLTIWHREIGDQLPMLTDQRRRLVELAEGTDAAAGETAPVDGLSGDLPMAGDAYGALASALQRLVEGQGKTALPADTKAAVVVGAASAEKQLLESEMGLVAQELPNTAGILSGLETEVTPAALETFASDRLGGGTVTEAARIPGGYSKDTFRFRLEKNGDVLDGIIRRDLPFGPGENTVVDEYDILEKLYALDFPVAQPLWCERDKKYLGQAFIVSRKVAGSSGTAPWDQDVETRHHVCTQLAQVLGRLHTLDPAELGLETAASPNDQIAAYVREWEDRWHRHRIHPSPTLAASFEWLYKNIPPGLERLSMIHADVGFHNILTDDGQIRALLDWEFSHLGDPAEDLGYCRQFVELLMPWDDFLAEYRSAGGGAYHENHARFYEVWRAVRNAVCCAVSWNGFLRDDYPAMKMAYQGIPLYRTFVRNIADRLEKEWI